MAPALIRPYNFKLGELFASTFTREAETKHVQSTLYSRSTIEARSSGGVETNTIIFIVVGVACLLVLMFGFYLVSRPRGVLNATPSATSSHPQNSPITPPPRPRRERSMGEYWKIWRIWRNTNSTNPLIVVETPTSQALPTPATIITPTRTTSTGGDCESHPPVASRPTQSRRITSLSVTTSFSHSHITEEELNNFRLSAYDLDGDLETEMLNSATDDVWPGQPLVVEGCGIVGAEAVESRSRTPTTEGSVEGKVSSQPTTPWKGGDYENSGACQGVASGGNGVE